MVPGSDGRGLAGTDVAKQNDVSCNATNFMTTSTYYGLPGRLGFTECVPWASLLF